MRKNDDKLNRPLSDMSHLQAKKPKRKTTRYSVEVWFKYAFSGESFWYDVGGSNQLDEALSIMNKMSQGSSSLGSFVKLSEQTPSFNYRIIDHKLKKVKKISIQLSSGQIEQTVLQDWHDYQE